MIEDSEEGVLFDEEVDIEIKKLPNLVISQIVWEDENGNELSSFTAITPPSPRVLIFLCD